VEDFRGTLTAPLQDWWLIANKEPDNLNVEPVSLATGSAEANQLDPCSHYVIACFLNVKDVSACVPSRVSQLN